jgi:hypothetical protein
MGIWCRIRAIGGAAERYCQHLAPSLPDLIRQSIFLKTTLLAKIDGCAGRPRMTLSRSPDAAQRAALRGVVRC